MEQTIKQTKKTIERGALMTSDDDLERDVLIFFNLFIFFRNEIEMLTSSRILNEATK